MANLKYGFYALIAAVIGFTILNGNGVSSGASTAQLDRALGIASDTIGGFEGSAEVNETNVMDKFSVKYNENLNSAQPPLNVNPIGVNPQDDGSLLSFDDVNGNGIQDQGEKDLFKMEVDGANNQLVASTEEEARSSGFSANGLLMGMLIGNMMSRQRATGTNPAARRTTAKGTPSAKRTSAKSRSGSGSHSRGK